MSNLDARYVLLYKIDIFELLTDQKPIKYSFTLVGVRRMFPLPWLITKNSNKNAYPEGMNKQLLKPIERFDVVLRIYRSCHACLSKLNWSLYLRPCPPQTQLYQYINYVNKSGQANDRFLTVPAYHPINCPLSQAKLFRQEIYSRVVNALKQASPPFLSGIVKVCTYSVFCLQRCKQ